MPLQESTLKTKMGIQHAKAVKRSTTEEVHSQPATIASRRLELHSLEPTRLAHHHKQDYHPTGGCPATVLPTTEIQAKTTSREIPRLDQATLISLWGQPMRDTARSVAARLPVMSLANGLNNEQCHCTVLQET